jgi:uncharacterized protein
MSYLISPKRRKLEILCVVLTGLGKILIMDILNQKLPFIITVIICWICYFVYRTKKEKWLYKYWGLSFESSKELFKITASVGVIVITAIIIYGVYIKPIHWSIHILFVLIVYPIWGLIQQFLMMSLFAGNIKDLSIEHIRKSIIILFTSIMFSIVHYPSIILMIATFSMALIYSTLFLKYRNILPLGLFHGIIGGLFYYVILNRDAWVEFVVRYISIKIG